MAEGTSRSSSDTVCTFPLYPFDEEERSRLTNESTRTSRATPCRYFLQGRCLFGDKCWNSHDVQINCDANSNQPARCDKHNTSAGSSRQHGTSPHKERKDKYEPKFCPLYKKTQKKESANPRDRNPPNWVDAPEFVPKTTKSYADTLKANSNYYMENVMPIMELCSYYMDGDCPFLYDCPYIHGDMCDICQKLCLNPFDEKQRKEHIDLCEKELEQDMELSFAIQRSRDKACGICMDVIMEKEPLSERRFGILEKCNHIFCLTCIRKWRRVKPDNQANQVDNGLDPVVTRACPECRIASDFITPSQFWVDNEEDKVKLISDYKVALSKKPCKYFKQGSGTCPFGGACFYLHAKPDGTKVDLPLPVRRRRQNQDGELDFMGRIFLWDYLEFREENLLMNYELEDLIYSGISESGSDTSEASDNFFLSESF